MKTKVERVQYFSCGHCENHLEYIFREIPAEKRRFDAGVFLIKHRTQGYILYDTGYSSRLMEKKLKYRTYQRMNPTFIEPKLEIANQLREMGISPEEIRWLILSHLHPDHIGGAADFPKAEYILTPDLARELGRFGWKDMVFAEFLPEDFRDRIRVARPMRMQKNFSYQESCDLFGDGSLLLTSIDGHATGQGCLYIAERNLLLAADVCWGIDLIPYTKKIRPLAYLVQKDGKAYVQNIDLLKKIMADGIEVVVSHDSKERILEILENGLR